MGRQEWTPPRRGFDEHMGYYDGCGTRYTHAQTCCGYQPDQRNAGGTNPYPAAGVPYNPGDGWGNPVPGEAARKYVCAYNLSNPAGGVPAYDWQDSGPTPVGGCPQEGCTSTPDVSVNGTGSCDLIRDRAIGFIERVGKHEAPYFLYLPFQNIHCPYTVGEGRSCNCHLLACWPAGLLACWPALLPPSSHCLLIVVCVLFRMFVQTRSGLTCTRIFQAPRTRKSCVRRLVRRLAPSVRSLTN